MQTFFKFTSSALFSAVMAFSASADTSGIELISPVLGSGSERAVDMNNRGELIGYALPGVDEGDKECAFYFNRSTRSAVRLCDIGFEKVFDINNKGEVVGVVDSVSNKECSAAVWSMKNGLQRIPKLRPEDTCNAALGINDKGEIVGVSTHMTVRTEKAFDDYEYEVETLHSMAFTRNSKGKITKTFPEISNHDTVAFAVANDGTIVGGALFGQNVEYYQSFRGLFRYRNKKTKRIRYQKELGLTTEYLLGSLDNMKGAVDVTENGQFLMYAGVRINRKVRGETFPAEKYRGRSDYVRSGSINKNGLTAGVQDDSPYLYTTEYPAETINCLFPANRQIPGISNKFILDVAIEDVGEVMNSGKVLVSAEISNDGAGRRILLITPPSLKGKKGNVLSYCPQFTAEITGLCAPVFSYACDKDTRVRSQLVPDGSKCSASVATTLNGEKFSGVSMKLERAQYCPTITDAYALCPLEAVTTEITSAKSATVNLPFNLDRNYEYHVLISDPRYHQDGMARFYAQGSKGGSVCD